MKEIFEEVRNLYCFDKEISVSDSELTYFTF